MKNNAVPPFVALGSRLRGIPEVLTLGVKPNFFDYSPEERQIILAGPVVLYPTLNYAQFLTTMGKCIFPSLETYLYADEKIKQTTLFYMQGIPHPRTRFYFRSQHGQILQDFHLPFIAKFPRASACGRGVFKITDEQSLADYLKQIKVAYIQEFLPHERDLRVVVINYRHLIAYWREVPNGDFRANISRGGTLNYNDIPWDAVVLAEEYARRCRLNDVGLDLILHQGTWYLIEANMQYGRTGLKGKGLVLKEEIRARLLAGELF